MNLRMPHTDMNHFHDLANFTPLLLAFRVNYGRDEKRRATVAALIAAGADVDASVSYFGQEWTAFTSAVWRGYRHSLLEVLRAGASIHQADAYAYRGVRNEDCFALMEKILEAGSFEIFATRQRAVPVAILGKIFGAALPHDVLPIVASFWMPRGGF